MPYWQCRGLYFVYLPPYSPKLNIIEILWRHIKQRWLRTQDYKDFETLQFALHLILMEIGNECKINFEKFNKDNYK
jgi:transposase